MSYRDAQAFLDDVPDWRAAIGMVGAPDHNTLWRAFGTLLKPGRLNRALDLMAADHRAALAAALRARPLSIDATHLEPRHRSRHYDRDCRRCGKGDISHFPMHTRDRPLGEAIFDGEAVATKLLAA